MNPLELTPEEQAQQQQQSNPLFVQPAVDYKIPAPPTQDFFWFRLDSSDILEELNHQLRGEIFVNDKDGGHYKRVFKSTITDEGINDIIDIVYTFGVNKNNILGCLTHEEIYARCNSIWIELAKYIVVNGESVGIDRKKRGILIKKIVYMIHSALSRSERGRESDQLSVASQRIEHFVKEDKPKSGGFNPLAALMPKRK